MTRRLVFRPRARLEIAEAFDWYEDQKRGLGDEFLRSVEAMLEMIGGNPEQYQTIRGDVRRTTLHDFSVPHLLFGLGRGDHHLDLHPCPS
jgi:toxin ParE1/3/4